MILHSRYIVIHSRIKKRKHNFLLNESQTLYFSSFLISTNHIVINSDSSFISNNLISHFLKHIFGSSGIGPSPSILNIILQLLIAIANNPQHNFNTFGILLTKHFLIIENIYEILIQYLKTTLNMGTKVLIDHISLHFISRCNIYIFCSPIITLFISKYHSLRQHWSCFLISCHQLQIINYCLSYWIFQLPGSLITHPDM